MPDTEEKKSVVAIAKERFRAALDAYSSQISAAEADTKFAMGDSDNGWQWPEDAKQQREGSKRVCLTVNVTAQHCNQIINQIRKNRPAAKVSPVDSGADKKTADILSGIIRGIHADSHAPDAHDTAAEHAVYGGQGYWRVITEYENEVSFNQVVKVKVCQRPDLVFIDPHATELDKSDAKWGFIFEDITKEQAKLDHPGIDIQSWESDPDGWCNENMVRRAEYFYCDTLSDTALLLDDGTSVLKSEYVKRKGDKPSIVKERKTSVNKWKWCKLLGGHDQPVAETEWLGDYLPIISVVGKEIYAGSELVKKGIVRDLKDQARIVNYSYSETVQTLALQNKAPYMAAAEAIEGYEDVWDSANIDNLTYLPFNAFDDEHNAIPAPQRQTPAVMPAAQIQLLQLSTEQMRAASGQQNANFGIKSEAQSGVGIQRLKQQGEVATFHFPDNLARALRHEARVLINLVQKYYDTERVVRIIGLDGKEDTARLSPDMQQAYQEEHDEERGEIERIFNPSVGRYDVVIDTGPSYQTMRQEAAANLNELAGRQPKLLDVAGDLIMRAQDFPMAEDIAERLEKTLPPGLKEDEGQQRPLPPEVQQQLQQMQQVIQQGGQQVGQLMQEKQAKLPELELKRYEIDKKYAVEEYRAETERLKVTQIGMNMEQVQDTVLGTLHAMEDSQDPGSVTMGQPEQQPVQQEQPGQPQGPPMT